MPDSEIPIVDAEVIPSPSPSTSPPLPTPSSPPPPPNPFAMFALDGKTVPAPPVPTVVHKRPDSSDQTATKKKPKKAQSSPSDFIPEGGWDEFVTKWQSFASPTSTLENRRYQILLSARLHARCTEVRIMDQSL